MQPVGRGVKSENSKPSAKGTRFGEERLSEWQRRRKVQGHTAGKLYTRAERLDGQKRSRAVDG